MSKFKDALERGKEARREQKQQSSEEVADGDAATVDFNVLARSWLKNVIVASLESAKADVAGEQSTSKPHRSASKGPPHLFNFTSTGQEVRAGGRQRRGPSRLPCRSMGECRFPHQGWWRKTRET
jgi:hypothetical protein